MNPANRQLRAITFVVFALMSTLFMLVYLDRWHLSPLLFALGIIASSSLVLATEVLAVFALRRRRHERLTRRQWAWDYAIASLVGSVTLLATLGAIGLAQDRVPIVLVLIFATRMVNTWVIAYAVDEIASYRASAATARRDLIPRLQIVRAMNEQLEQAETASDSRDLETIRSTIWRPLERLRQRIDRYDDTQAASEVETFIDRVLRPLSHELHPITAQIGLVRAISGLGFRVETPAVISELDDSDELLDDDVRLEAFRWISQATRLGSQQPGVLIDWEQRALSIHLLGAQGKTLDPLQRAAGLTLDASDTLHVPLRGQLTEQLIKQATAMEPKLVGARFLPRAWQWRGNGASPSLALVAALAFVAVPGGTYVANASVSTATAAAAATWLVVPLTLAWIFRKVSVRGQGVKPLAWFLCTWVGLGVLTGLASGATYLFFDASGGGSVVAQEVARGFVRLTLIGGLVALTAEFADNAQRALANIDTALQNALVQRADILTRARDRSQLIAEVLHRRVQGRMAAIAVLFRLNDHSRALSELDAITSETLPELMSQLIRSDTSPPARIDTVDVPPGLHVVIDCDEASRKLPEDLETIACTLIEESAANAHKHGHASLLHVRVRRDSDHLVIECADNGVGVAPDRQPGLGSRLFDDAVGPDGSWYLGPGRTGALIRFELPQKTSAIATH